MTGQASMGDWIRRAYRGDEGCPPPEAYLPEELAGLDPGTRERLERHAESCAACAAERDLARSFEAAASARATEHPAVERIARRLERRPPHGRGWLAWIGSWGAIAHRPAFQFAAAAVLVIGVGLGIRNAATPPDLGPGPGSSVTRSSAIQVEGPVGEISGAPERFAWLAAEGAVGYVVTVRGVDGTELWSAEAPTPGAAVDRELEARLEPAVWYVWTVEAHDGTGRRIAWSPEARFRIAPAGE